MFLLHILLLSCAKMALGVSSDAVVRRTKKTPGIVEDLGQARCDGKVAFYHWDAMAPNGFGCQYNHWITFLSIALLEDRVPAEVGNWSLTCPRGGGKAGFWDCFSSAPRRWPRCKPADNVYVSKRVEARGIGGNGGVFWNSLYAQHMRDLNQPNLAEWHLDGDMIRGHNQQLQIECKPVKSAADKPVGWTPSSNSDFARKMCADTHLPRMDVVQIFRYVAQRVVPIEGFEAAKRKCRALWGRQVALAIHIRRTDKVFHEDKAHPVEEYVNAAQKSGWNFDILHIVTDDPKGVETEWRCDDFSMLQGMQGKRVKCTQLKHTSEELTVVQKGGSFAGLLDDLACLAEADYMVGSGKSNMPWLVQTLRSRAPGTAIGLQGEELAMP